MLELGINNISFLLFLYLKTVYELFATRTSVVLKESYLEKAKELIELREKDFLSHEKDYWPTVIKDTTDLFNLLKVLDATVDWREKWKEIRRASVNTSVSVF